MDIIDIILGGKRSGGGLPVVELTTVPTAEGATLNDEEAVAMNEAVAMGVPVVVKYTLDELPAVSVFSFAGNAEIGAAMAKDFSKIGFGCTLELLYQSGSWLFLREDVGG